MDFPGSPLAKVSLKETSGRSCLFPSISPTTAEYLYIQQGPQFHSGGGGAWATRRVPLLPLLRVPPAWAGGWEEGRAHCGHTCPTPACSPAGGSFKGLQNPATLPCPVSQGLLQLGRREGRELPGAKAPSARGWGALVKYQPHLTDGENKLGGEK